VASPRRLEVSPDDGLLLSSKMVSEVWIENLFPNLKKSGE
jgi:hypothetical protein